MENGALNAQKAEGGVGSNGFPPHQPYPSALVANSTFLHASQQAFPLPLTYGS